MKLYQLLLISTGLALSSCQVNYTFPDPSAHKEDTVHHTGHHGAHGCAYKAGMEAVLLAKTEDECTDEEWAEEYQDIPGQGYRDGQWCGENSGYYSAQQVFQCEDGDIIILDDNGEIIFL